MAEKAQDDLLNDAKKVLGCSWEKIAQELGVDPSTLYSWRADKGAAHYRNMPETARLLLARIVKDAKAKK